MPLHSAIRSLVAPLLSLSLLAGAAQAATAKPAVPVQPEELPAETLTSSTLNPAQTERIYVADVSIAHIHDGRIRVFDARTGKLLGMISTGYVGNFALSAKADELYVATSYLSRGTQGERTDVLELHDTTSLARKGEILLPTRRAQALPYRGLVRTTANGRFVLVQNATPATSITVVDLSQGKTVAEVQTPGCWGLLPAASHGSRFSMLCGDGKLATVTLDGAGQVADRQVSEKFFDADKDAWFHHAEQIGDRYWFVSFKGQLTEMDLGGPVAQRKTQTALVSGPQAEWRPGGYQLFSVHPSGRYAVVAMHDKGGEGSHKRGAVQLWTFDLNSGKRLTTAPGMGVGALTFSRNGERLHTLNGETGELRTWQWDVPKQAAKQTSKAPVMALKQLSLVKHAGDSASLLESHD